MPLVHIAGAATTEYPPLYRAFERPEYADQFASGTIRITTFQKCKAMEGNRRDEGEGLIEYQSGLVSGGSDEAHVQEMAHRLAMRFENCDNVIIDNTTAQHLVPDALLVCMTKSQRPDFGPHVVRIDNPSAMFDVLSQALDAGGYLPRRSSPDECLGVISPVLYRSRGFLSHETRPMHPGLIKPPLSFASDGEVRMMWPLQSLGPQPFFIRDDRIRNFCTRL